ncbi:P-loop containing nucleoside triphosphate hydrolase protein [Stereum hirsutum FP-91666 SS1]|uniref:p-loop containing nucleoside triphosphate hydrolase protein n=1 Tax=Stereum hirsutum (strain FP-91666) TaxID=721885 RepID=R7RW00_STEHR|nr:P-loop containing nucleoside triphosphate hydrolase protein [Stereum hirsutum FP-91666 SS1]EIM79456.1 P-loop containing nucleoside triphosphate hydrolase protein [Stereum hirsutum FP-91666 SS1]
MARTKHGWADEVERTPSPPPAPPVERSEEDEALYQKSIVQQDRKLLRHQIWSRDDSRYIPFDPESYKPPPIPPKDEKNYFYINSRRQRPAHEPSIVLSDFSDTLVTYLRVAYGDQFYSPDPEKNPEDFFTEIHRKTFRKTLEKAKMALDAVDPEEQKEVAVSLGYLDAKLPDHEDEETVQFLKDLVEHLPVLNDYLEEQFEPTAKELELCIAYGNISFDLLKYLFTPGDELTTIDMGGKRIVFVLQSTSYHSSFSGRYFDLRGHGYEWDGTAYTTYSVSRQIQDFTGTEAIDGLSCQHTTAAINAKLAERGELYTSYAGVHYKLASGARVIIDGRGYREQDGYSRSPDEEIQTLDPELLHLLPPFQYGFDLKKKEWGPYLVEDLQEVKFDENAWDHLVLDSDIKTLIRSLVQVTRNSTSATALVQDVISGKGGGLIAVLHGPPGTGKTLTAEAVAEHLKRPLYMVGSSELSTNCSDLEDNLKRILSLATAWDAVLLIDEADVFLEQRSLHELERNALVSVALRLLEYHRGVLFLTTNRIKAFDDAFLSRFSIAVKYPELDKPARLAVWKRFLAMAGQKIHEGPAPAGALAIEEKDLDALSEKPFNGRTVKNLVRTAQALALSMQESLEIKHINVVVRAQEKFLREFAT